MDKWLKKNYRTESDSVKKHDVQKRNSTKSPTLHDRSSCDLTPFNDENLMNGFDSGSETFDSRSLECSEVHQPLQKLKSRGTSKKRRYIFQQGWLEDPKFKDWLMKASDLNIVCMNGEQIEYGACKLCRIKIFPNIRDITRHFNCQKHSFISKQVENTWSIERMMNKYTSNDIKYAELKLTAMLATNNLPFLFVDTLVKVCADIFPDSTIAKNLQLHRTKATYIMTESLGLYFKEEIYSYLRIAGNFFSIIMDETTDVGTTKQCAFTVIFYSSENQVSNRFFDMIEVESGTSEALFNSLMTCIKSKNIPLTNLVGFASDTTNVMVGEHNSVFSHLKKEIEHIVCVRCSCHMIHLSACKACLELPRHVEDLLRNVGSHFSRSSSRQMRLKEFQSFFKTELHKILHPSQTRWLSVEACASRVLEQYRPLKAYFTDLCFEDPSVTNEDILSTLNNVFTKIYLEFMVYILNILNNFNTLFQSNEPLLHKLKPEIIKIFKIIYSNYIRREEFIAKDVLKFDHTNPRNFLPIEKMYLGVQAQQSLMELKQNDCETDIELFLKTCMKFYIKLLTDIKTRFDFSDEIFELITIVDPSEAQKQNMVSLYPIVNRFPFLNNYVDRQLLDNEWREHSLLDFEKYKLTTDMPAAEYWQKVFLLKNAANIHIFPNLKKIMSLLLILPFSNANVERIFSELNNIKTDLRNKLKTKTVSALISTKEGVKDGGGCVKFKPTREMLNAKIWNGMPNFGTGRRDTSEN